MFFAPPEPVVLMNVWPGFVANAENAGETIVVHLVASQSMSTPACTAVCATVSESPNGAAGKCNGSGAIVPESIATPGVGPRRVDCAFWTPVSAGAAEVAKSIAAKQIAILPTCGGALPGGTECV